MIFLFLGLKRKSIVCAIEKLAHKVLESKEMKITTTYKGLQCQVYIITEDRGPYLEAMVGDEVVAYASLTTNGMFSGSGSNAEAWLAICEYV